MRPQFLADQFHVFVDFASRAKCPPMKVFFMRHILLLVLIGALLFNGPASAGGSDNRFCDMPDLKAYEGLITARTVTITMDKWDKVQAACMAGMTIGDRAKVNRVYGCARFDVKKNRCAIFVPIPEGPDDGEFACIFYHELLHCQLGDYHE